MARVNQPLISQSARELRAKEKASWPRWVEKGSCSAGRFMIVSNFISSMREGIMVFFFFFLFLECGNFAYNVSHQVDPRQEDDRKCQSVECVESSIEREKERGR